MRGIDYVQLPTTLLAQVDSSIGGKTGVNLSAGKNLIGSFHHPLAVFADTETLATLPPREFRAGLHEVNQGGDHSLAATVPLSSSRTPTPCSIPITRSTHPPSPVWFSRASASKLRSSTADERESGLRMILNFGHTLGHAIEAATGYKQLLHGEAVAWGSIAATHLALLPAAQSPRKTLHASSSTILRLRSAAALHGFNGKEACRRYRLRQEDAQRHPFFHPSDRHRKGGDRSRRHQP